VQLRNTIKRQVEKAKKILESWNTKIAQTTLEIINSGEVKVLDCLHISKKALRVISDDNNIPHSLYYINKREYAKKLLKKQVACYYENEIYISDMMLSSRELAETLVHEINHHLNQSHHHYQSKQQIFQEEFRAHVAEHLAQNPPITRQFYNKCAQHVSETYKVPIPKSFKPEKPAGAFHRNVR